MVILVLIHDSGGERFNFFLLFYNIGRTKTMDIVDKILPVHVGRIQGLTL